MRKLNHQSLSPVKPRPPYLLLLNSDKMSHLTAWLQGEQSVQQQFLKCLDNFWRQHLISLRSLKKDRQYALEGYIQNFKVELHENNWKLERTVVWHQSSLTEQQGNVLNLFKIKHIILSS